MANKILDVSYFMRISIKIQTKGFRPMDLYFNPLSCSLASRIALYESELPAAFIHVDPKTKLLPDGTSYLSINPRGQVPCIRTDDGEVLTENVAILEYIADLKPEAGLAPAPGLRHRMRRWLAYVNSELHVGAFSALLSSTAAAEAKSYAAARAKSALAHVDRHLEAREWLADSYSVADIYLAVVSNWLQAAGMSLSDYPNVKALRARVLARPAAARAFEEELSLYRAAA
jgi:glutathione S-transferase